MWGTRRVGTGHILVCFFENFSAAMLQKDRLFTFSNRLIKFGLGKTFGVGAAEM